MTCLNDSHCLVPFLVDKWSTCTIYTPDEANGLEEMEKN